MNKISVIRCKDCKRDLTDMCMMINGDNGVPRPDDYCSYGEEKEEIDKRILCPKCGGKKYIHVTSELLMGWGFQSQSLEEPYMKCVECGYEERTEEFE